MPSAIGDGKAPIVKTPADSCTAELHVCREDCRRAPSSHIQSRNLQANNQIKEKRCSNQDQNFSKCPADHKHSICVVENAGVKCELSCFSTKLDIVSLDAVGSAAVIFRFKRTPPL